ncbi:MAG: hypothetical protein J0M25_02770 [Flavobacteriales bacterium]|nr:hypothetical protein [Flavobacteriales bacterium]
MNILERAKAPTPKFFKVLRAIGITMATIGGTLVSAPIAIPVGLATLGGYFVVAGGVMTAVSQVTVQDTQKMEKDVAE